MLVERSSNTVKQYIIIIMLVKQYITIIIMLVGLVSIVLVFLCVSWATVSVHLCLVVQV